MECMLLTNIKVLFIKKYNSISLFVASSLSVVGPKERKIK